MNREFSARLLASALAACTLTGSAVGMLGASPVMAASSGSADLQVVISPDPDHPLPEPGAPGWTFLNITVTNNGPDISSDFTITNTQPSGTSHMVAGFTGCSLVPPSAPEQVSCKGGPLAIGQTAVLKVALMSPITGVDTATVTGSETDPNTANNSSSLTLPVANVPVLDPAIGAAAAALAVGLAGANRLRRRRITPWSPPAGVSFL